jgi:hypothetical protein
MDWASESKRLRQSPHALDDAALREVARRCVDEGLPVYELALALSRARQQNISRIMFGGENDNNGVRTGLKDLEFRARHGRRERS